MKKITLLLSILIGISSYSQTVYRLYKTERFNYDAGWVQYEEITYQYDNHGTQETLLLNKTVENGVFSDDFRHIKSYNSSMYLIEDIKQTKIGNDWVNETRKANTYDGNGNISQELEQIANGSAWENVSKKDYTYPDESTTIVKGYEFESGSWVQYTEEIIELNSSGYIYTSRTRDGDVLVNEYQSLTILIDGIVQEQIIKVWDDLAATPEWINESRYIVTRNAENEIEKEELFDWNIDISPADWKLSTLIDYERSESEPNLVRTYYDCDTDPCEESLLRYINFNSNGKVKISGTSFWDSDIGENGGWQEWNESNYEYDENGNLIKNIYKSLDFFNMDNGLVFSLQTLYYWEEASTLSLEEQRLVNHPPYPNPAKDYINISFQEPLNAQTEAVIYDLQGKLIQKSTIETGSSLHRLNLQQLSEGLFMIHIKTERGVEVHKIIKNDN